MRTVVGRNTNGALAPDDGDFTITVPTEDTGPAEEMQQAPDLEQLLVNGRYKVARRLQSGFFGTTWLAQDTTSSQQVCLKTFFRESRAQHKELAVLRELCVGRFCHENLCAVLDVSLDYCPVHSAAGGQSLFNLQYVVFEYCSGSDLFNFLVTGPYERIKRVSSFPEPLARHYFTQVLMAVMYLHERGVFHRDIKPENCVLDQHFNLKLTDFGTNKIFPLSSEPTQVLRTATANIGTDSYRAPEVNGIHGYDPAAADIWSLGVTLFFLTGIEEMVGKVATLDPYRRAVLAPLGVLFPFPLHCTLLESYLKPQLELQEHFKHGAVLQNEQFWLEWGDLWPKLSPALRDIFNRVFVLEPSFRCSLRQLAGHAWLSGERLSPQQISQDMLHRCPSDIQPSKTASPRVVSNQLGGVDQAALRHTLSSQPTAAVPEFLADAEVAVVTDRLIALEALQIDMLATDIQDFMLDVTFAKSLLRDLLSCPTGERERAIPVSQLPPGCPWLPRLLSCLGYLPQGRDLFLPLDALDLALVQTALSVVDGIELAVFRGAVSTATSHDDEMMFEPSSLPTALEGHMTSAAVTSDSGISMMEASHDPSAASHDLRPPLRKFSSNPEFASEQQPQADTLESFAFIDESSQDSSAWTAGSLSAQSSQEEVPEVLFSADPRDLSQQHYVMQLDTAYNRSQPHQYRAAVEFCKLSGLLASYGLYQVVCREQLALYCRGNATSFSARLVSTDNASKVAVSSWCFVGVVEWAELLERVKHDMVPQKVSI